MKVLLIVLLVLAAGFFIWFIANVIRFGVQTWLELSDEDKEEVAKQLYENSMDDGFYDF